MNEFNEVKDSGTRKQFDTGAVRDIQEGKGMFHLISTIGLRRIAKHYENGARKYSARNWEKGMPLSCFWNSAMRHMLAILEGDKSEDHCSAWAWNAMGFMHIAQKIEDGALPKELDDIGWTNNLKPMGVTMDGTVVGMTKDGMVTTIKRENKFVDDLILNADEIVKNRKVEPKKFRPTTPVSECFLPKKNVNEYVKKICSNL